MNEYFVDNKTKRYLVFGNIIIIKDNTPFHFIEVEFLHFP